MGFGYVKPRSSKNVYHERTHLDEKGQKSVRLHRKFDFQGYVGI